MKRDITARSDDSRYGISVGGGPHTHFGVYNIGGLTCHTGPAGAVGRNIYVELTPEEAEDLVGALQSQIARAKEQMK